MQIYLPTQPLIEDIHEAVLEISGGRKGILDNRVIDAAVHRPKTYLSYHDDCDLHTVCAVLIDSLARNHAFVEGNKRTAIMTVILTYELNGFSLRADRERYKAYEDLVLWVVLEKPAIPDISEKLTDLSNKFMKSGIGAAANRLKSLLKPFNG